MWSLGKQAVCPLAVVDTSELWLFSNFQMNRYLLVHVPEKKIQKTVSKRYLRLEDGVCHNVAVTRISDYKSLSN